MSQAWGLNWELLFAEILEEEDTKDEGVLVGAGDLPGLDERVATGLA
jgi:hypothetical protein